MLTRKVCTFWVSQFPHVQRMIVIEQHDVVVICQRYDLLATLVPVHVGVKQRGFVGSTFEEGLVVALLPPPRQLRVRDFYCRKWYQCLLLDPLSDFIL